MFAEDQKGADLLMSDNPPLDPGHQTMAAAVAVQTLTLEEAQLI